MGSGDTEGLRNLLHPAFSWISHKGEHFNRDAYLRSNTGGSTSWHGQELHQPEISVIDRTAVLTCVVTDDVSIQNHRRTFRMPMTQVWVNEGDRWLLLAGHAGPLMDAAGKVLN
jgi:hypothetical protein